MCLRLVSDFRRRTIFTLLTPRDCPLSKSINPNVRKRIRCAVAAGNHFVNRCNRHRHARASLIRRMQTETVDLRIPAITTHPRFDFEQTWMHLRFSPTVAVGFGLRCSFSLCSCERSHDFDHFKLLRKNRI